MTCYAFIDHQNGGYTASVPGWPDCMARGLTRQEALARLREMLHIRLSQGELVPLNLESAVSPNPWVQHAGRFKDDPFFDEMVEEIETYRRELDARGHNLK